MDADSPHIGVKIARRITLIKAAKTATALLAIYVHRLSCDDARNPRPAGPGRQFGGLFRGLIVSGTAVPPRKFFADERHSPCI